MYIARLMIDIPSETIRKAAWELWEEVVDRVTENTDIEDFDEIVDKIIKVIFQDKGDS